MGQEELQTGGKLKEQKLDLTPFVNNQNDRIQVMNASSH